MTRSRREPMCGPWAPSCTRCSPGRRPSRTRICRARSTRVAPPRRRSMACRPASRRSSPGRCRATGGPLRRRRRAPRGDARRGRAAGPGRRDDRAPPVPLVPGPSIAGPEPHEVPSAVAEPVPVAGLASAAGSASKDRRRGLLAVVLAAALGLAALVVVLGSNLPTGATGPIDPVGRSAAPAAPLATPAHATASPPPAEPGNGKGNGKDNGKARTRAKARAATRTEPRTGRPRPATGRDVPARPNRAGRVGLCAARPTAAARAVIRSSTAARIPDGAQLADHRNATAGGGEPP